MVEGKLPEVDPPSGRVPRRGLLALLILEARRWRNRGEIAKRGSVFGSFTSREIYRRRGQPGGTRGLGAPWRGQALGRARWPPGALVGPTWSPFETSEGSFTLIFYLFFPSLRSTFNMGE